MLTLNAPFQIGKCAPRAVVHNLFYISNPFIKEDYQIYPQYSQWCSFIKNMQLTNSYSVEWFIKIYICWNDDSVNLLPLEDEIYPRRNCTPN